MVAVLMQFRVVLRSIRRHYRSVELECGVTGAQLWALAQIDTDPGIRLTHLAKALAIHQTSATNMVDNLVELRLVERRREAGDLRVTRLFLTAKGKRTLGRAPRPLRGVLQQALLDLPEATLRGLRVHLEELLRHLAFRDAADRTLPLSDVEAVARRRR
jgi:DNA-binding MarR family transcriptional regulator